VVEHQSKPNPSREGMREGFSLRSYLLVVEYTGRPFTDAKSIKTPTFLSRLATHRPQPGGVFPSAGLCPIDQTDQLQARTTARVVVLRQYPYGPLNDTMEHG
jgi:hypothetical protein